LGLELLAYESQFQQPLDPIDESMSGGSPTMEEMTDASDAYMNAGEGKVVLPSWKFLVQFFSV
jgi:hypothetical protein